MSSTKVVFQKDDGTFKTVFLKMIRSIQMVMGMHIIIQNAQAIMTIRLNLSTIE